MPIARRELSPSCSMIPRTLPSTGLSNPNALFILAMEAFNSYMFCITLPPLLNIPSYGCFVANWNNLSVQAICEDQYFTLILANNDFLAWHEVVDPFESRLRCPCLIFAFFGYYYPKYCIRVGLSAIIGVYIFFDHAVNKLRQTPFNLSPYRLEFLFPGISQNKRGIKGIKTTGDNQAVIFQS